MDKVRFTISEVKNIMIEACLYLFFGFGYAIFDVTINGESSHWAATKYVGFVIIYSAVTLTRLVGLALFFAWVLCKEKFKIGE